MTLGTPLTKAPSSDAYPLAAQIPLQSFTLPEFPQTAKHLRELTLTSDIDLSKYQSEHLQAGNFEPCTTLPQTITHITLELFSLGFPSPFLTTLAASLPNLRSLTLFNCLFDGIDEHSRKDALKFFEKSPLLRELHVIDSFARAGFWEKVAGVFQRRADEEEDLRRISSPSDEKGPDGRVVSPPGIEDGVGEGGLQVVEVSYTYRGHDDGEFLSRVLGEEWAGFVGGYGSVGVSFNLVPPVGGVGEAEMKGEDGVKHGVADGILPYASDGRASGALRKRIERMSAGELWDIQVLNLSMFTLQAEDIGHVLYACANGDARNGKGSPKLVDLTVSLLLEDGWEDALLKSVEYMGVAKGLESLEIIGVPAKMHMGGTQNQMHLWQSEDKIEKLERACSSLRNLTMSILRSTRTDRVQWRKLDGKWKVDKSAGHVVA